MIVEKVQYAAGERCELTLGATTFVIRPEQARQLAHWILELWPEAAELPLHPDQAKALDFEDHLAMELGDFSCCVPDDPPGR